MRVQHFTFGNGMTALDALRRYKMRRKLMLQPTRELHAGMVEFQRINGYRQTTYAAFVDAFFPQPHTGDMVQYLDDIAPHRAYLRGQRT